MTKKRSMSIYGKLNVFFVLLSSVLILQFSSCLSEPEIAEEPPRSLLEFVAENDRKAFEEMFGISVDLEERDESGRTALQIGIERGDAYIVQALLHRGASPNTQSPDGDTALHLAVRSGSAELAGIIVQYDADLYIQNDKQETPLDLILSSNEAMFRAALTSLNKNSLDENKNSPLHHASKNGVVPIVKHLLDINAELRGKNLESAAALDLALNSPASHNHALIAELLVKQDVPGPRNTDFQYFVRVIQTSEWNRRFEENQTALHLAAARGHSGIVKLLIQRGTDVHSVNASAQTALHAAVSAAELEAASELLAAGANSSARDENANGVYYFALTSSQPETVCSFLLRQKVDPDIRNENGNTALHLVLEFDLSTRIMSALLENGADPDLRNTLGVSPLLAAVLANNRSASELLIKRGANIFSPDNSGRSAINVIVRSGVRNLEWFVAVTGTRARDEAGNNMLHYAAKASQPEALAYLAEQGVGLQETNRDGDTPLHISARQPAPGAASVLLKAKADFFAANNSGQTPVSLVFAQNDEWWRNFFTSEVLALRDTIDNALLHYAVMEENPSVVDRLLQYELNVNAQNRDGLTALHTSAMLGQSEIAVLLVNYGINMSRLDNQGNTPLHLLGGRGARDVAEELLARGAVLDARNSAGRTPLQEAARRGSPAVVSYLLNKGAFVNTRDNRGRTPIFDVVQLGFLDIAQELVNAAASITIRDLEGNTALHVAVQEERYEFCRYGREMGADIFAENRLAVSVLGIAFGRGLEAVNALVNVSNINVQNNQGNTPLHLAFLEQAALDVVYNLLDLEPDLTIRNGQGLSAYEIAKEKGYPETLLAKLGE